MAMRKGLGKNKGKGYYNIINKDKKVHSESAKGMKQPQRFKNLMNENRVNESLTELEPVYDARPSFYGKAQVLNSPEGKKLFSYNTHVATIKNGKAEVYGTYSQTTLRHIKDFLKQNGFKAETKQQIEKDYED